MSGLRGLCWWGRFKGKPPLSPPEPRLQSKTRESKGSTLYQASPDIDRRVSPFAKGGTRGISWASNQGEDQCGQYADFKFKEVTQRLRLIPAGTFWMGTKGSEGGFLADGNHHQVTLTKDFWLADTACTQSLWQVVMGENPSRLKEDPNCPVEQVSWDAAQQFIHKLNQQNSGLHAGLPSEAQWEYACRAGTETAYSFGEKIDKG